jgi:uncharacterized Zn finger protein (UPF0148 family)
MAPTRIQTLDRLTPGEHVFTSGKQAVDMKFRGQRECQDCGTRWSYYETGEVACPNCESLRSRGIDERTEHTDAPVPLDLSPSRSMVSEGLSEALNDALERCREFVTRTGFIHAGELKPLSETYLTANELVYAARESLYSMRIDDDEEVYLLSLLRADTGQRPPPEEVPRSMRTARGLAAADAVGDYRSDLRTCLDDGDPIVRRVLATIAEHVRRIEALDGDVEPVTTERLVHATQDIGEYVRTDEEERLATARDRLDEIE